MIEIGIMIGIVITIVVVGEFEFEFTEKVRRQMLTDSFLLLTVRTVRQGADTTIGTMTTDAEGAAPVVRLTGREAAVVHPPEEIVMTTGGAEGMMIVILLVMVDAGVDAIAKHAVTGERMIRIESNRDAGADLDIVQFPAFPLNRLYTTYVHLGHSIKPPYSYKLCLIINILHVEEKHFYL